MARQIRQLSHLRFSRRVGRPRHRRIAVLPTAVADAHVSAAIRAGDPNQTHAYPFVLLNALTLNSKASLLGSFSGSKTCEIPWNSRLDWRRHTCWSSWGPYSR